MIKNKSLSEFTINGWVNSLICTNSNEVWMTINGSKSYLLQYSYDNDSFTDILPIIQKQLDSTESIFIINKLFVDSEQNVWFSPGLRYLNPKSNKVTTIKGQYICHDILEDTDKMDMWFATKRNGLFKYNKIAKELVNFRHNPKDTSSLSSNKCYCLLQDSGDTLWIGTDYGLNKLHNEPSGFFERFTHKPDEINSISINIVYDIDSMRFKRYLEGITVNCII